MSILKLERPISKDQLEQLYLRERLSMAEIANKLGCSVNKVVYWMDRYEIARRQRDEASYVKHNPNGDPFEKKNLESAGDLELFHLVLGLYLGEGTKKTRRVAISNADPRLIRLFLRFLRETCGVNEKKIRAWMNIFDDVNLEEAQAYWERVTGLSRSQFFKPTVRPSRGGSYINKSQYGTITIEVSNSKLFDRIEKWCKAALEKFGN